MVFIIVIMDFCMNIYNTIIILSAICFSGCAIHQLPSAEGKPRIPINNAISDEQATIEKKEAGNANVK